MLLASLTLALTSPAATGLACNPSGPRPQHCGQSAPAMVAAKGADAPRVFCHPDPSKNRGCTRADPHAAKYAADHTADHTDRRAR